MHKLLPSKKFVIVIGSCVAIVLIVLGVSSLWGSHGLFSQGNTIPAPVEATGTVGDVISRDSNNNGIPDWEESLWGLDPKGDGAANKKTIDEKRAANAAATGSSQASVGTPGTTATDQFARELLSTILALNQSGSLTPDAVARIGESIGANIDSKRVPETPTYVLTDMLTIKGTSPAMRSKYMQSFKAAFQKATDGGLGTEFDIISSSLDSEHAGAESLAGLAPIAKAYADFGKQLTTINTPDDGVFYALALANASASVSKALEKTSLIYTDAISGMVGVDDYLNAFEAFDGASGRMAEYLRQNP